MDRPDPGGDLSSAGINLCDRGLLDESDHPCWLDTVDGAGPDRERWLRGKSHCGEKERRLFNFKTAPSFSEEGEREGRKLGLVFVCSDMREN